MKSSPYTGKIQYSFEKAPRCGAMARSNNGLPCRSPAVRGKQRCRMHGGGKGSGAQVGNTNALKHGATTAKIKGFKKTVKQLIKRSKDLAKELGVC